MSSNMEKSNASSGFSSVTFPFRANSASSSLSDNIPSASPLSPPTPAALRSVLYSPSGSSGDGAAASVPSKPSRRVSFSETHTHHHPQQVTVNTHTPAFTRIDNPSGNNEAGSKAGLKRFLSKAFSDRLPIDGDDRTSGANNTSTNTSSSGSRRRVQLLKRKELYQDKLNSRGWNNTLFACSILLCFGAQIRDILPFPSYFDYIFNVAFIICFAVFVCDIFMRVVSEPNYYDHTACCGGSKSTSNNTDNFDEYHNHNSNDAKSQNNENKQQTRLSRSRNSRYANQAKKNNDGAENYKHNNHHQHQMNKGGRLWIWGSFLFWCDVVSTLTLLYDISWTNPDYFEEKAYNVYVDEHGLPMPDSDRENYSHPISIGDIGIFIAIGKSARMARFILSRSVVHLSSYLNFYFLCHILCHPRILYKLFTNCYRVGPWTAMKAAYSNDSIKPYKMDGTMSKRAVVQTGHKQTSEKIFLESVNDTADSARDGSVSRWSSRKSGSKLLESLRVAITDMSGTTSSDGDSDDDSTSPRRGNSESQVGSAMRELTSERIAIGIIFALLVTALFTYVERDSTRTTTMIVLFNQTTTSHDTFTTVQPDFITKALTAARSSSVPGLFSYQLSNGTTVYFPPTSQDQPTPPRLRPREIIRVNVVNIFKVSTSGRFTFRLQRRQEALVSLLYTFFILLVWLFGVTAFSGPVMMLVVIPIERMVKLLGMLMLDPLGYQRTRQYKRFQEEQDELTRNTQWTREVLKGMETSFLMSTITRIGSLMQVGFGSAGVEIIRQNLERSKRKTTALLTNAQGSIVPCIFLFCDIRNFTDATESLQEEVFVFTNSIAAVVHSHCASMGGCANKNVGDAFLCSWMLDQEDESDNIDESDNNEDYGDYQSNDKHRENLKARHYQADKCLLAVVRICMALRHDDYYLEALSVGARSALISKLANRPGSIVQVGFGLHAGKAVQGAIGSTRKIDATYLSEAVELSEFLESSTKKYGLKMLMSDAFHRLLDQRNKNRCRKVDQIMISESEEVDDDDVPVRIMDLLTFDMDIDALAKDGHGGEGANRADADSEMNSDVDFRRVAMNNIKAKKSRKSAMTLPIYKEHDGGFLDETNESVSGGIGMSQHAINVGIGEGGSIAPMEHLVSEKDSLFKHKLKSVMPPEDGNTYNASVWSTEEMRIIRQRYSDGIFFQKFNAGLHSFYGKDWDDAKHCFTTILARFEDGPSRYFLNQIEKHDGVPPHDFLGYGKP